MLMLVKKLQGVSLLLSFLLLSMAIQAQDRTITGKVTDAKSGNAIAGASVVAKGTNAGTSTNIQGEFSLVVGNATKLVITSVGFNSQEVDIAGKTSVTVVLETSINDLNEIIVVGYGTARKKDLTGAVSSVKAKDFNQGIQISADQLIQGKVAGVQIVNNSGQPGGATSVRIRGNASIRTGNQPLYVVDGVPLDGRSARPGAVDAGFGASPDGNPLNYINPNDIASIDVLKDASATAIYGSRGANGVVLITTKRGQSGAARVEVSSSFGVSSVLKKLEVLDAATYRKALSDYSVTGTGVDGGSSVDAFDEITRQGIYQNYNVSISGGSDNARMRSSFGYLNQEGIVRKSGLKRYTANLSGALKFLDSKKLGLDFNIIASQTDEQIAPISNNAGSQGSLIGMALQWNPTKALRNPDGTFFQFPTPSIGIGDQDKNPLALSEYYDDQAKTTNVLASLSPYYKFSNDLEYRMTLSLNYGSGVRRSQVSSLMNLQDIYGRGFAFLTNSELTTQQLTHVLNYNKELNKNLTFGATLGYEFMRFKNKGFGISGRDFTSNSIPYTNYFQGSTVTSLRPFSYADPITDLQSYFVRANINFKDKYLLTASFRADGSSKFGENNKYGYFPSFAAAWVMSNEDFLAGNSFIKNLKLRAGWGLTGNQEFPAGAAQERYRYFGPGDIRLDNIANPDLKWETSTQLNIGVDFAVWNNRLSGSIDYFNKDTKDLLFNFDAIPPAPAAKYWSNIDGNVINSGLEVALNAAVVAKQDLSVNVGMNAAFLKNKLTNYTGAPFLTGEISGQGLTGARAQQFVNNQPVNVFYLGHFLGLDKNTGEALYEGGDANANRFYAGSPNPTTLLGLTANATYKKWSLSANMNGAFGHMVYNNTVQASLAVGNIAANRNLASSVYTPGALENKANAQPVSDRYLEKGNYLKMANMTLSYNVGQLGKSFRNVNVYVTGQNLFVITNYTGFDPEVNTPKPVDNVPSFGIEHTPYPSARSVIFGLNISL